MNENSVELYDYSGVGKIAHIYNDTNGFTGYYLIDAFVGFANSLMLDIK